MPRQQRRGIGGRKRQDVLWVRRGRWREGVASRCYGALGRRFCWIARCSRARTVWESETLSGDGNRRGGAALGREILSGRASRVVARAPPANLRAGAGVKGSALEGCVAASAARVAVWSDCLSVCAASCRQQRVLDSRHCSFPISDAVQAPKQQPASQQR